MAEEVHVDELTPEMWDELRTAAPDTAERLEALEGVDIKVMTDRPVGAYAEDDSKARGVKVWLLTRDSGGRRIRPEPGEGHDLADAATDALQKYDQQVDS